MFITVFIMHNPEEKPSNWFILLMFLSFFNSHTILSVRHGYSTMGGIEGVSRQKRRNKFSHQLGKLIGYGDAHQLISVQVNRDCHATDALEL